MASDLYGSAGGAVAFSLEVRDELTDWHSRRIAYPFEVRERREARLRDFGVLTYWEPVANYAEKEDAEALADALGGEGRRGDFTVVRVDEFGNLADAVGEENRC